MAEEPSASTMDMMQLYAVLGASLSQDSAQRKAAEDTLKKVRYMTHVESRMFDVGILDH